MAKASSSKANLDADLLVIGGGAAGLSAAATAAREGAHVIVLERDEEIGGSAALSAGWLWSAPTLGVFREENPLGSVELGKVLIEDFPSALEWVSSLGVARFRPLVVYRFGRGFQIDIVDYLRKCASIVNSSGGNVVCRVDVRTLIQSADGRVVGARVKDKEGTAIITARNTLLATGGFQGSPKLRAKYIHKNARRMMLRSNRQSVGHGLRLGLKVGAASTTWMDGFYGHLISSPANRFTPSDFTALSQYYSNYSMLINWNGDRFTDESAGDQFNVQAVLRQPHGKAVVIVDERVRQERVVGPDVETGAKIDKFKEAVDAGARFLACESVDELARGLRIWGVDGDAFVRTLARYNTGVFLPDEPQRKRWGKPLVEPPFYALEVQPAITFSQGGLEIDPAARVLNWSGTPVIGLLAAGADAGGLYNKAYAGGLAMAVVFGRRAALTALESNAQVQ
jgi:succinate dehydrogenase/fumarate reductase flavoprotein subunit